MCNNVEFKAGDKVYFPSKFGSIILTLNRSNSNSFPLGLDVYPYTFSKDGKYYDADTMPSIFHATEENRQLLSKLYGIEFEKLPTLRDELIEAFKKQEVVLVVHKRASNCLIIVSQRGIGNTTHFVDDVSFSRLNYENYRLATADDVLKYVAKGAQL